MRLSGLCIIIDSSFPALQPWSKETIVNLLQPGVGLLQYRDKHSMPQQREERAMLIKSWCNTSSIPLIINDDVMLAQKINADGVHLGATDMPVAQARALLGKQKIIGASCYQSLTHARTAQSDGADYVAFGAVFPSPTKPQAQQITLATLAEYKRCLDLPICAIGGITSDTIAEVMATGTDMVAIASHILTAPDPTQQTKLCLEAIKKTGT